MELVDQLAFGIRSAVDAPDDFASAGVVGLGLQVRWISEDRHGFGVQVGLLFDMVDEESPSNFLVYTDLVYVYRASVIDDLRVALSLGPTFWYADGTYLERCPSDECTPEQNAKAEELDERDSAVLGGVVSMTFDHPILDELFVLGVTAEVRVGSALADDLARVRWAQTLGLRFGANFEL